MHHDVPLRMTVFGLDTPHAPGFGVQRPKGLSHEWLIMCFTTPALVSTSAGMEPADPGDCVIHPARTPHWHSSRAGSREGFRNDWVHLAASSTLRRLCQRFGLPLNQRIVTRQPRILSPFLEQAQREQLSCLPLMGQAIELQIHLMLLAISRAAMRSKARGDAAEHIHRQTFLALRQQLQATCVRPWRIEQMARVVHLSPSRFAAIYPRLFGVSPLDDLLNMRINQARRLLLTTHDSMSAIASQCGFGSLFYFSRVFRRRVGVAPSEYARNAFAAAHD